MGTDQRTDQPTQSLIEALLHAQKIGEIWKKLDQMKGMRPARTFPDHPFKSYSSLKMKYLKTGP
jgi:hypothetical protein